MEENFDSVKGSLQGEQGSNLQPGNKNSWKWVLVVPVIAIVAIALYFVSTGTLMAGDSGEIVKAAKNTFNEQGKLMEALKDTNTVLSKDCRIGVAGELSGYSLDMAYNISEAKQQLTGKFTAGSAGSIDFIAQLDDKNLKFQVPQLLDKVITYNYAEPKTGYISEVSSKEEIDAVDSGLKYLAAVKERRETNQKLIKVFSDSFKTLKFQKAKTRKCTIDGKEYSCKGYSAKVKEQFFTDIIDQCENILTEHYEGFIENASSELSLKDSFDEMREAFDDMPNATLSFYIYDGKLAAVYLTGTQKDDEVGIEFTGGKTRLQNWRVVSEGDVVAEFKGSEEDGVEKGELTADDNTISYEYHIQEGDLIFQDKEGTFQGYINIESDKNTQTFEVVELEVEGKRLNGTVTVSDKPEFKEVKGEEFDAGNASEEELENLSSSIKEDGMTMLYSMMYGDQ